MELPKTYSPADVEGKWYAYWLQQNYFHAEPDNREPFTIVIPPPNVTGVLHMGHMLNNTIQDVLIRKARMQGKNACWVPGTDHASIATEAKVVQMLREKGIKKSDLSREEFLKHAWSWKEKYGGIILEQLKKLGASCDWQRTRFTMDPSMSEAVTDVFIDLYKKGLIYRGLRMVNWDPQGKTALSDEEVIFKEVNSKLYYIRYFLADSPDKFLVIATTRPETILADTAICVNPNDERFKHLVGKKVRVPFINREIPVIADEYVDMEFGTGCLKVTPAHDRNDYELGTKYNLPVIDILDEQASLNEKAEDARYIGKDRFEVRKQIALDLEAAGHIEKIEEYKNQVGTSERTGAVIEPRLSLQWFVDMKAFIARNPQVLDAVMSDEIKFHPAKMKNTYKHWIDNIKDWCISRQLWWGQRIPAWYNAQGDFVVAKTAEEALALFSAKGEQLAAAQIKQDDDVVDTWFSSWLWPVTVFDGLPSGDLSKENVKAKRNADIKYFYPTNDLVTAPEIMFFWVARMIMAGYEWMGEKPFSNVYYTGIVRDKQRRKMSKSLGNSPDPLDLIALHGADAVRMGMLLCSPAGNDILYDESLVEQGRNFSNKLWNAFRLVKGWESNLLGEDEYIITEEEGELYRMAVEWMHNRITIADKEMQEKYESYHLSEVLMRVYRLIWDDFCSEFLEMMKPQSGRGLTANWYFEVVKAFKDVLILLHPFMPFITEEIWQTLGNSNLREKGTIMFEKLQCSNFNIDLKFDHTMSYPLEAIKEIRNIRQTKGIPYKDPMKVYIRTDFTKAYGAMQLYFKKRVNADIEFIADRKPDLYSFLILQDEAFVDIGDKVDAVAERSKIATEIEYLHGFLKSVDAKLSNEKFVANAKPELVEKERQKKADAEAKILTLQKSLESLN